MKKLLEENRKNIWFWLFSGVVLVLFFVMPIMSRTAGNTGDEDNFQIPQGRNIVNYFKTGGEDTTCITFENLKYYGCSFDVVTEFFNQTFGVEDIHLTRHAFNAFLGWLSIFMVGLIAYLLTGSFRAGVVTMLLLFLSPRFLGHSFNNPKDIPFSAAVITAIYGILLFFKQFPKVKWYTYLILILSIAFSISVRVGGVILFGYFVFFALLYLIRSYIQSKNSKKISSQQLPFGKQLGQLFMMGIIISVVSYILGILLWPYALQSPIKHVWESFTEMSNFDVTIRQIFDGNLQWSDLLPWYYTPKYILITIPIAVIIGVVLFFIFCWRKKETRLEIFFIFFTFFFPIFWIVLTDANVYGGWRHAMFAYPPMVVAAGLGFNEIFNWLEQKFSKFSKSIHYGSIVLILVLLMGPISHILRNHPYEYVYFNKLVGGVEKAYGNYELDYYYHSTREAAEWVKANAVPNSDGSKIKVASWHQASVAYFFRKDTANFSVPFVRWYERGNVDWDYAIFTITGITPEQLRSENFPPKNMVHSINVDGKPICIILKRETKDDFIGYQQMKAQEYDSAIVSLTRALKVDPLNESIYVNLSESYYRKEQIAMAKPYIDKLLKFAPTYESGSYMLGIYYLSSVLPDEALKVYRNLININSKYSAAYHIGFLAYAQKQNIRGAEKVLNAMVDAEAVNDQGIKDLLILYLNQGLDEYGAYKKLYKTLYQSYERKGKKKEAEIYRQKYNEF